MGPAVSEEPAAPTGRAPRVRLVRAGRLAWRHRTELLRALVLLPVVAVLLRRRGQRATAGWLADRRSPNGARGLDDAAAVPVGQDLAFVVRLAARPLPDATCLRTALVLQHLLARRGVGSVVRLGARPRPGGGEPAFHAWVEVAGEVVSEPVASLAGFVVLSDDTPPPRPG